MRILKQRSNRSLNRNQNRAHCNEKNTVAEMSGHFVRLLQHERLQFAGFHNRRSPGVESRFQSSNVEATVAHLRQRARLIAEKNPFVFGRLRKHDGGAAALWIPDHPPAGQAFLTEVYVEGTHFGAGLAGTLVKKGRFLLDNDQEPVVKLCVIRSKDPAVQDFVLTLSASHVIGEMNMIYNLWGMLQEGAEIVELIQERVHHYRGNGIFSNPITAMKGAGFRKFLWYLLRSHESPFRHEKNRITSQEELVKECSRINHSWIWEDEDHENVDATDENNHVPAQPHQGQQGLVISCNFVNMEWIREQKQAHADRVRQASATGDSSTALPPYISTQDILTAWFFGQWDTAGVAVAYDMRRRNKALTQHHMGNYLEGLVLFPKEYKDPCNIRRAIESQGKWEPPHNHPGTGRSVGGITGWHSLYQELNLPHAVRLTHSPLRDAWGNLPPLKNPPLMILFKTSPEQYAIWSLTREEIRDRRALGDELEF